MRDDTDEDDGQSDRLDRAKRLRDRRDDDEAAGDRSRRIGRRGRRDDEPAAHEAEAADPEAGASSEDETEEADAAPSSEDAGSDIAVEVTVPEADASGTDRAASEAAADARSESDAVATVERPDETPSEDPETDIPVAPVSDVDGAESPPATTDSDAADTAARDPDEAGAAADQRSGADDAAVGDAATGEDHTENESLRVLEFRLGGERYVLAIEYVEEIMTYDGATRVPNGPPEVAGVVDLRGQITTLLDPEALLSVSMDPEYVVVLDSEGFETGGNYALLVDDVTEVGRIETGAVATAPGETAAIEGVVRDEDGFRIWLEPGVWTAE